MKSSTHLRFFLPFFLLIFQESFCQNFAWVRGINSGTTMGVYGTQGVPSPGNDPGSRHGAATWTDSQGNLWMFGGEGILTNSQWYSDLWKYNPTTNQWTWVKGPNTPNNIGTYGTLGVPAVANNPGCREFAMSWTDAAGNFWLFGGDGCATTFTGAPLPKMADLWKYSPVTNQWTWMGGPNTINATGVYGTLNVASPANYPGGRYWGANWVDGNGKFWMFGGRGFGSSGGIGRLGDLWKFDPLTNQWTWVSGTQNSGGPGVFGTLSVPSAGNYPGGRECPGYWLSSTGKLVLFGGQGYASTAIVGVLNDMWEYNITTGLWTWINGSNTINPLGNYGTMGVPSTLNSPGGRLTGATWTDPMGNYWLFGGEGLATVANYISELNDLFRFNPVTSEWTWMKGANVVNQTGTYGTQGVPAFPNTPGARAYNVWWRDSSTGFLWLFGGIGYGTTNVNPAESMNDLWRVNISCNPDSAKTLPVSKICSGNTVTVAAYNLFPSPVNWYTTASGGVAVGSGSLFSTPSLTAQGSPTVYTYYAEANSCSVTPRAATTITVLPLPQLTVTGPASVCPGQQTATLTASGALTYTWSNGTTSSSISFTATAPIFPTVVCLGGNGCQNTATFTVGIYNLPNITANTARSTICKFESVVLTAGGGSTYVWNGTTNSPTIAVSPTISTTYTVLGTDLNGCSRSYTITQFVANCIGIATYENTSDQIVLYPNPGNGAFNMLLPSDAELMVLNQLGEVVFKKNLLSGDNYVATGLCKGLYLYRILFSNRISTGKIVVE